MRLSLVDQNPQPVAENENPVDTQSEAGEQLPEWARRDSNARPLAPEPPDASDGQRPLA